MIIKSIELENFRNYDSLSINFDEHTTILFGNNAQGKTNILEAAYISGTTKSHKGSRDKEIIKFDKNESHIKTIISKNNRDYQIDIHLKKNKSKGIAINRVPIKKAAELFGLINIIFFSPEDLNIIKNGPAERRKFMDAELCQIDKIYLSDLTNYNKALNQRNALLKEMIYKPELKETLTIWDEQLINYGKKIITRRQQFIDDINIIVKDIHSKITSGKENIDVSYDPNIEDIFFLDELVKNKEKDMRFCQTSVGPHRDDIKITVDGIDIRKFGSQGQQRTCALSLKLSEIRLVENTINDKPILLLDDVLSELDKNRQSDLLDNLLDTQTIITCTGIDEFVRNRFRLNTVYKVTNGSIELITEELDEQRS
ncbi:DNA replication/repair protein RecF [Pseudobutyrivibrio xylanivorans]|uniref:DNA replication and repair protein RecF n=1 Tax=Pseudobutyrivibrio xylanivorans TaxID=185007 RepID=A0A5P6VR77_PSEXY|nr:DNA replication/repair protein RecF [Pseudobutyrivibrio xylanivorans]QFJ54189.1 DNA replication/repair protein RecF [Pseudobutyrivibrio xylanivorans]